MSDPLETLGRARLTGATLLALTFVVGLLGGAAGERLLLHRNPPPRPQPKSAQPRDDGAPRLPSVLEEMTLTPAQRSAIDSILASGRPRNEAIIAEVLPRFRAVGDTLNAAIREVLTREQAAKFDAYLRSEEGTAEMPPIEAGPDRAGPPPQDDRDRRPPPPDGPRDGRRPPPRDDHDGRRPPPPPRDGNPPPPPRDGDPPPPPPNGR